MVARSAVPSVALTPDDFDTLAICAFRYALGRQSYMVGSVADVLRAHHDELPEVTRRLICREINEAIAAGLAGGEYDVREWVAVRAVLHGGPA